MSNIKFLAIFLLYCILAVNAELELEQWNKFKLKFNKNYESAEAESKRFEIFQKNLKDFEEHNAKYRRGETTYEKGINMFADMTHEEIRNNYLVEIRPPTVRNYAQLEFTDDVPATKNWTAEGMVTRVKTQKTCGCCYIFASVGAVESANAIANRGLIELSEQQVLDCSYGDTYLNYGCLGGIIEGSIHYVVDHGIQSEETYPYDDDYVSCRANASLNVVTLSGYKNVPENQTLLQAAVGTIAPVAACVAADEVWFYYKSGIMSGSCNDEKLTSHVILIVGYGTEDGVDYWLVKNSWTEDWGIHGYGKVRRNGDNDYCISTYTAYAIV